MISFNVVASTSEDTVVAILYGNSPRCALTANTKGGGNWKKSLSGCCASRATPISQHTEDELIHNPAANWEELKPLPA